MCTDRGRDADETADRPCVITGYKPFASACDSSGVGGNSPVTPLAMASRVIDSLIIRGLASRGEKLDHVDLADDADHLIVLNHDGHVVIVEDLLHSR